MKLATNRLSLRLAHLAAIGVLSVLTLVAQTAAAQNWTTRTVGGNGAGAVVKNGATVTQAAAAAMPDPSGGQASQDTNAVNMPGTLSAAVASSVTAGQGGIDGLASAQTVSSAANVNILNGLITADRVVGISSVIAGGNKLSAGSEGSGISNLVINGVSMGSGDYQPAPNTRVNLPGGAWAILNEQVQSGHGSQGLSLTVNMIHVYTSTGEIIVGSATSSISS